MDSIEFRSSGNISQEILDRIINDIKNLPPSGDLNSIKGLKVIGITHYGEDRIIQTWITEG